ncbi:DMT family transporter [Pseudogracilibacillus auburnensis]|uniref:DMT family transporter n=1 Tax=Pseudogracilibacillus auburnensis TaxID=1494959 RepID=UPI001A971F1D|nr:DMT family transporter [Pseudogracilibacillus auburnensis]MBO1001919.1 DMT family transporter [Pseudogracilibacillus auburnensis]
MGKSLSKSTLMLLLLILIWGASWPIYKLAVPYTPPLLFAGMRAFFGGILLAIFIWKSRNEIQWRKNWQNYCISAFFNTILFFGLQTVGLNYLPAGLFSVLVYCQPILLGLFAWLILGEYLSGIRIVGLCIGFIGIIVASTDGLTTYVSVIGVTIALLTGSSWAYGVIFVKKVSRKMNAFWMVSMQSIIGGATLIGSGTIFESWSEITWNISYIFGLVFGMTMGIPLAYIIYYTLVNQGEASKVGSATFLVPIISVILGVIFLGETLTYKLFIGMILVGISIYLVNFNAKKGIGRKNRKREIN